MLTKAVALNPVAVAVFIVFLLPDRRFMFEGVNQRTAGGKTFSAVRRTNGNNDAETADVQPSLEVGNINIHLTLILGACPLTEVAQYIFRQKLKDIITDAPYSTTKIGFSHHADETIDCAVGGVGNKIMRCGNI